jgi:hypothetical protein
MSFSLLKKGGYFEIWKKNQSCDIKAESSQGKANREKAEGDEEEKANSLPYRMDADIVTLRLRWR